MEAAAVAMTTDGASMAAVEKRPWVEGTVNVILIS